MSAARRAAQLLQAPLRRGFKSTAATAAESKGGGMSHEELVYGKSHHGPPPGYPYDWEHGPHYLRPDLIPNFKTKWAIGMGLTYALGFGIPIFAVWWQQSKLKTA